MPRKRKSFDILVRYETELERARVKAAASTLGLSMQEFAHVAIMRWVEIVETDAPISETERKPPSA